MASEYKAISISDEKERELKVRRYRMDREGQYGWNAIIHYDGSKKPILFRTIEEALETRMKMGIPLKKIRIVDIYTFKRVL